MTLSRIKIYFIFFLTLFSLKAHSEEEIKKIDHLIATTEQQLQIQQEIKRQMLDFHEQKELFLEGKQTLSHTALMLKTATGILILINENHLHYLFSSEYMEELALFTSIGAKKSPARP